MDCHSDRVGVESGLMTLSLGRPSSWMLSWFWRGMQKVVPQPVCSNGGQNLAAGERDPDQVQGQGDPRVRKSPSEIVGLERLLLGCPVMSVCLSVCLSVSAGWSTDPRTLWHWGPR
jgi:hypothetical protein